MIPCVSGWSVPDCANPSPEGTTRVSLPGKKTAVRLVLTASICATVAVGGTSATAAPESASPASQRAAGTTAIRVYDPPVTVRSQRPARDVKDLRGAPANLRQYLPSHVARELMRAEKATGGALPASCTRRMVLSVQRVDGTGWALVAQRLVNAPACGFDAGQTVVVKATTRGRGRVAVRLGSGGQPDCSSLTAAGVPLGLVPGC